MPTWTKAFTMKCCKNIWSATLHQEKKEKFEQENGEKNFKVTLKVCFKIYLLSFNIVILELSLSQTLEKCPKLN